MSENKKKEVRFICTYLPVSNLQRSLSWYEENFGFDQFGGTELRINSTVLLTLVETSNPSGLEIKQSGWVDATRNTRPVICFCVSDVEELHVKLKDKGIPATEIVRTNWGSLFEFTDPDQNRIEVWSGYSDY